MTIHMKLWDVKRHSETHHMQALLNGEDVSAVTNRFYGSANPGEEVDGWIYAFDRDENGEIVYIETDEGDVDPAIHIPHHYRYGRVRWEWANT